VESHKRILTREQLFELVWQKPMSRLAGEFGLSDVGLAKTCKKFKIPIPGRGHWAKVSAGRVPPRPKLPKPPKDGPDRISFSHRPAKATPDERPPIASPVVPKELIEPDPLVAITAERLEKASQFTRGYIDLPLTKCLDIRVSPSSSERAVLIFDTLIKTLRNAGYGLALSKEKEGGTFASVDGEKIPLRLIEKIRQHRNDFSREKDSDYEKYGWYRYEPTGLLSLCVPTGYGYSLSVNDGKVQRLETSIVKFIDRLRAHAASEKARRIEREKWREEQRARERIQAEQRRKAFLEEKRREKIKQDALDWSESRRIEAYVHEMMQRHPGNREVAEWAEWALKYADELNPMNQPESLAFREENVKEEDNFGRRYNYPYGPFHPPG